MKNIIRTLTTILIITLFSNVSADNAENDLLKKRAFRLRAQRQYEKAAKLHEMVLENNPSDVENVYHLILNLIQSTNLEKAEDLLNKYKKQMLGVQRIQLELMLLLTRSEFVKAEKISNDYLETNENRTNNFGIVARIFEQYRQYDIAVKIYLKARKLSGDDNSYCRELANSYFTSQNYEYAVIEYIKLLQERNHYSSFVLNKFKEMLKQDRKVINYIKNTAGISEDPSVKELYALSLGEIEEFSNALKVYESLPNEKLLKYADRMLKKGYEQIAIDAYNTFLQTNKDNAQKATIMIRLAQIHIDNNNLQQAEKILLEIYNDKTLTSRRNRYQTKASRQCRELLAEISLMRQASNDKVLQYLYEAKKFAYNTRDRNEVKLKIVRLNIMNQKTDIAKKQLSKILTSESSNSEIFKKGYYYSFLIAIMTKDAEADSLLSELLVTIPEDEMTNDALRLFQIVNYVSKQKDKDRLLKAYRKRSLYRFEESLTLLDSVYQRTNNENILFLYGEWALEFGAKEKAKEVFLNQYKDSDLQQYAKLKLAEIEIDSSKKKNMSTSFLEKNPNSIFAPQFRRILSE